MATPASLQAAVQRRNQTLLSVLRGAVSALSALDDDALTRRVMLGTVHDVVRTHASEYAELAEQVKSIAGVAQLQLDAALSLTDTAIVPMNV